MDLREIIARLDHHDQRIHQAITRALCLRKLWLTFQEADGRAVVAAHAAGGAMAICEKAVLHETVIILVRLLDEAGRGGVMRTNRVTFPVLAGLLRQPGVEDELGRRAREWVSGSNPDRYEANARRAVTEFHQRLERLKREEPNREKLLRDFRDENLAHELYFQEQRERPLQRHVTEMIEEVRALSDASSLAIRGTETAWEFLEEDVVRAGNDLYRQLSLGIETERATR